MSIKRYIYIAVAALALSACQKAVITEKGYGSLNIGISDGPKVEAGTKACLEEDVPNYTIKVEGDASGLPYSSKYSQFRPLKLPYGAYTVSAENATAEEAEIGFGLKRLHASKQAVISAAEKNANVVLDCTVANCLVTIDFNPSLEGHCQDLTVSISGGDSGRMVEIKDKGTEKEVWFNPSTISWTITGTIPATGKQIDILGNRQLSAKEHLTIKISLDTSNGMAGGPELSIGTKLTEITKYANEFNPYN